MEKFYLKAQYYKFLSFLFFGNTKKKFREKYLKYKKKIKKNKENLNNLENWLNNDLLNSVNKKLEANNEYLKKKLLTEILSIHQSLTLLRYVHLPAIEQHKKSFSNYKAIHKGKKIVLLGTGTTLNNFIPIPDAIYIGVNRAFKFDKIKLDYLFIQDNLTQNNDQKLANKYEGNNCKKFYGQHYLVNPIPEEDCKNFNAEKFYFIDQPTNTPTLYRYLPDILSRPLNTWSSIIFPAFEFALWTQADEIYIVGCDCSGSEHFDNLVSKLNHERILIGWNYMKNFAKEHYPSTKIISVNPVGLKGYFTDFYQNSDKLTTMYKVPKILFLNDTENHYHFGCTGTSFAIKSRLLQLGELVDIVSITNIWNMKGAQNINDFDDELFFQSFIKENINLLSKIYIADICIFNGEGNMHGFENRAGTKSILYLMYILKKRFNKKVHIINHSCFPVESPYLISETLSPILKIYKKVYEVVDFIAVRDSISLAILNRLGIFNTLLAFDCLPIYINEFYTEEKNIYTEQNYIVISGGSTFHLKYQDFLENSLTEYQSKDYKIIFLMSKMENDAQDDYVCINVINQYNKEQKNDKNKIEIFYSENINQWLSMIKNAKKLISGRFHHSIAACIFNIPFICYEGNTPKNNIFKNILNKNELSKLAELNFNEIKLK